jgi:hypothetical protein
MDIETRMRQTARHEAYHACYAVHKGLEIERISILADAEAYGHTVFFWPWPVRDLWWRYRQDSLRTLGELRAAIGALLAPSMIQESPLEGADRDALATLERAWHFAHGFSDPPGPRWDALCAQAEAAVLRWFSAAGCREQVSAVTEALLQQSVLSGEELLALVKQHRLNPLFHLKGHSAPAIRARILTA